MTDYQILIKNKVVGSLINPEWIQYDDMKISAYCAGMMITLYRPDSKLEKIKGN